MATNEIEVKAESKNKELKHLGFVRVATIKTYVFVANLYECAKKNAGPLRPAVGTAEGTVTTVLGPVYNKLKGIPDDVLVYVDNKFDEHAPPFAKQLVDQAKGLILKVKHEAGKVASEAQSGGPRAAVDHVATESKHILLTNSVKLWTGLNHFPPFHAVAEMTVPTAAHWLEKYNHVIKVMTEKGYSVVGYLPLIPVDDIAKEFKREEAKLKGDEATCAEQKSE